MKKRNFYLKDWKAAPLKRPTFWEQLKLDISEAKGRKASYVDYVFCLACLCISLTMILTR